MSETVAARCVELKRSIYGEYSRSYDRDRLEFVGARWLKPHAAR